VPKLAGSTAALILPFPGRHATLAGNGAIDGSEGSQALPEPGVLIRHLAEKYLTEWGTQFNNRSSLTFKAIAKLYKAIADDQDKYQALRGKVYYGSPEAVDDERFIGIGASGKGVAFSDAKGKAYEAPKGLSMTDAEVQAFLTKK
jgi:hypothetical protein